MIFGKENFSWGANFSSVKECFLDGSKEYTETLKHQPSLLALTESFLQPKSKLGIFCEGKNGNIFTFSRGDEVYRGGVSMQGIRLKLTNQTCCRLLQVLITKALTEKGLLSSGFEEN